MLPNFSIFGKQFTWYMIAALTGLLLCVWFTYRLAQKKNLDEIVMLYTILWSGLGVVIGGHYVYGMTNFSLFLELLQKWTQTFDMSFAWNAVQQVFGGSVFYGGLIGGLIAGGLYLRRVSGSKGGYVDIGAIAIPLFHTFGRMGCFLSGCCYGVPWQHGITMYHSPVEVANGIPRFPVQLVEAGFNFLLFLFLLWCFQHNRWNNRLLAVYLLTYPVARFFLEFLRGDEYRGFLWGLSTSQIISVLLFAGTIGYLLTRRTEIKKETDTEMQ